MVYLISLYQQTDTYLDLSYSYININIIIQVIMVIKIKTLIFIKTKLEQSTIVGKEAVTETAGVTHCSANYQLFKTAMGIGQSKEERGKLKCNSKLTEHRGFQSDYQGTGTQTGLENHTNQLDPGENCHHRGKKQH